MGWEIDFRLTLLTMELLEFPVNTSVLFICTRLDSLRELVRIKAESENAPRVCIVFLEETGQSVFDHLVTSAETETSDWARGQ